MKELHELIQIEFTFDNNDNIGTIILLDPSGDKSKEIRLSTLRYEESFKDSQLIIDWLKRYRDYRAAHDQPPCPWQIDSAVYRYPESRRDQRYYVIRHAERGTFLHADGTERTLTHHDEKPTGIYESKEAAEATLLEGWYNTKDPKSETRMTDKPKVIS